MLLNPLSLMGSSYADNALSWSAQRTLNWLPETAEVEGTRTPVKFADPPGLRAVVDLGTGAPIRGLHNAEGKLFAVSGTSLFEISTAFVATNRGNIPGVARVSMAHNKQGGAVAANELAIGNGLSGYVYNTATQSLVQITDDAFQGAGTFDYVDGFITFTDPQGRYWGHSALNQATSYSSIDRNDAESAPDPIVSHIVSHRLVMVFGTRTTEFFRNTGAATGTFQRYNGTELEIGICAPFARSRVDNSVCWVGDGLEVFRLEGTSPQRISTRPIEQLLATVNPANIFTTAWEDRGHKVIYVTAPEAFTVGFDFASGMWHERQTFDLPRWRANDLVAWNGLWIVGDYSNGLLYVLDWDTHHENGLELIRERASGYTHAGQNKVLAPYVELLFDTGTENPDAPVISGDVPDAEVGTAVSGAYTVTGGIPPYSAVTVLSGTFPPGLTLNPDGTYSGTYTTTGAYSWTVGGTDAYGSPFSTPDTADVLGGEWWVTNFGSIPLENDLYISTDPLSFGAATTRTPNIEPSYGPKGVAVDTVLVANLTSNTFERITDMVQPVDTVLIDTATPSVRHIRVIDGIIFIIPLLGTAYRYSLDDGVTWLDGAVPGSPDMADIARLENGRWLALVSGLTGGFYYSDEDLPTVAGDWTLAGVTNPGGGGHADGYIAVSGNTAVSFGTGNVKRTENGETWDAVTGPGNADRRDGTAINGTFVCMANTNGGIHRSVDDGLTWATVVFTDIAEAVQRIETGGGAVVACTNSGEMWVSLDDGENWTESTTPGANGKRAAYVVRSP